MKKLVFFLAALVISVGLIAGTAWTEEAPESGEWVNEKGGSSDAPPFEVTAVNPGENAVKFLFPVRSDQYQTDKEGERLPENPDIQVYASYAYSKNGKWVLTGSDDFRIETGSLNDGQVEAHMSFPKDEGTGWYWVRTWAKDSQSGHWVWIDEESEFCRNDDEGNPGYEFLVNPETGERKPVPSEYNTRD